MFGEIVDEEARHDRRDRRHQEHRSDQQAQAGHDRQQRRQPGIGQGDQQQEAVVEQRNGADRGSAKSGPAPWRVRPETAGSESRGTPRERRPASAHLLRVVKHGSRHCSELNGTSASGCRSQPMAQTSNSWSGRTVVVVEDEFLVRDLVSCELEDNGFVVVGFDSCRCRSALSARTWRRDRADPHRCADAGVFERARPRRHPQQPLAGCSGPHHLGRSAGRPAQASALRELSSASPGCPTIWWPASTGMLVPGALRGEPLRLGNRPAGAALADQAASAVSASFTQ